MLPTRQGVESDESIDEDNTADNTAGNTAGNTADNAENHATEISPGLFVGADDLAYRAQLFCTNLSQTPVEQPFVVTSAWQEFSFDLTTFEGCDTTGVQAIVISTGPTPGEFAFQIDEVSLQR